jgi:hypothetical protein
MRILYHATAYYLKEWEYFPNAFILPILFL